MSNWILVNYHRRSGTHFLIDSLRMNLEDAIFPAHRKLPKDFNVGSLFRKDETVFEVFADILYKKNQIIIIKSHLLPEEMNLTSPKDKYEKLVKKIFLNAHKLYIYRECKDVLTSLHDFLNPDITLSSFIRERNDHIPPIRNEKEFDSNRVEYWRYHIKSWLQQEEVINVQFSDLKNNFEATISKVTREITGTTLEKVKKPKIPRNKILHRIKLKLYKLGLIKKLKVPL